MCSPHEFDIFIILCTSLIILYSINNSQSGYFALDFIVFYIHLLIEKQKYELHITARVLKLKQCVSSIMISQKVKVTTLSESKISRKRCLIYYV